MFFTIAAFATKPSRSGDSNHWEVRAALMPAKRRPMHRPTLYAHISIAAVLPGIWTTPSWSPCDLLPGHHGPRSKTKRRPPGHLGTRQCGIALGVPQHLGNPFGADDGPATLGLPGMLSTSGAPLDVGNGEQGCQISFRSFPRFPSTVEKRGNAVPACRETSNFDNGNLMWHVGVTGSCVNCIDAGLRHDSARLLFLAMFCS